MRRIVPSLLALSLAGPAWAGKVPATVNVGLGPNVVWLGNPGDAPLAPSVGLTLMAEGWVGKKALRSKAVMRQVPRQYRGLVKSMPDAHIVPLPAMLVPDIVGIAPVPALALGGGAPGPTVVPVSWAPIDVSLVHRAKAKGPHVTFDAQPRVSWLRMEDAAGARGNAVWLGAAAGPVVQSNLARRVGLAVGGHWGAGYVPAPKVALDGYARPWMHVDAFARLQLRFPIEVDM
jgi:hypothetical protein